MSCLAGNGQAQEYPSKVLRLVVSSSAGSSVDTIGRLVAAGLTQVLGKQVIVDNRTGGGSNIGADYVAKSAPDGYTLLLVNLSHALNVSLYHNLSYNLVKDFAPVTRLTSSPQLLVVHSALPVKSVADLVKLAKARPGALNNASSGTGTPSFLAAELFKNQTGANIVHVPYKGGGEALTAVMQGEVQVYFSPVSVAQSPMQQGLLRGLGVTSSRRLSILPDMPTIAESGYPGYECVNWYGLAVPAGTPRALVDTLRQAAIKVINTPETSKRLVELGFVVAGDTPEQFAAYIQSEIQKLAKVVHDGNLSAE